jgi:excisionase family DNA binding protein
MVIVPGLTSDLTVKEFAQLTAQAESSVYRQHRLGKIPSYRVGGSVRIRREAVQALRQPQAPPTAELLDEIRRAVDNWPPLTADQRAAVAAMFAEPDSGDPRA